jgi:nicotinate-nucleotide--dimethylbenzimidazole phosphoribosyltransferase
MGPAPADDPAAGVPELAANEFEHAPQAVSPPPSQAEPTPRERADEPVVATQPLTAATERQATPSLDAANEDAQPVAPIGEATASIAEPSLAAAPAEAALERSGSSPTGGGAATAREASPNGKGSALPDVDLANFLFEPPAPTAPLAAPVRSDADPLATISFSRDEKSLSPTEEELADFLFDAPAAAEPEPALVRAAPQRAAAATPPEPARAVPASEPARDAGLELAPLMVRAPQPDPAPPPRPAASATGRAAVAQPRASFRPMPADPLAPLLALSDEEKIALFS